MSVPEGVLSAKRFGNLDAHVDVVAASPFRDWMGPDNSLLPYVSERFGDVVRLQMPRWIARLPLGRLGILSQSPDYFRFLNSRAAQVARGFDLRSYDLLATWSQWHSIHLVGAELRRSVPGCPPWVAHFSDPWTGNPYSERGWFSRWLNRRLEGRVLEQADLVTVTSQETKDLMAHDETLRQRVHVVPHAFDPALYRGDGGTRTGPLVLRYIGAFYGLRTPAPLFVGLARLRDRGVQLDDVRVELVGDCDPSLLHTPEARALPPGLVHVRRPVPYLESLRLMSSSDVLLVIDAPLSHSVFLPSKLIDYLGAGRPVLGITPPGAARGLISRLGGFVASPQDPDEIASALVEALNHARADREAQQPFGDAALRDSYDVTAVGRHFRDLLDRTIGPLTC